MKIDHIINQYKLSQPQQQLFLQTTAVGLVVVTNRGMTCWAFNQWSEPLWTLQPTQANTSVYAFYPFYTASGTKIAFVTGAGQLYLINSQGLLHYQQTVIHQAIWHITGGWLGQRPVLFASCTDHTIRVFDLEGQSLGQFVTPGPILSLAVASVRGRIKLAGGMQGRSHVYLWDWQTMVERQNATPEMVLSGGTMPAFAVLFDPRPQYSGLWQSCGDGNVYFYDLSAQARPHSLSPTFTLPGHSPVYPLLLTTLDHITCLLMGTESGEIVACDVDQGGPHARQGWIVARLRRRVKCLTLARVGGQDYLVAGGLGGQVHLWQMGEGHAAAAVTVLDTHAEEVRGVAMILL